MGVLLVNGRPFRSVDYEDRHLTLGRLELQTELTLDGITEWWLG